MSDLEQHGWADPERRDAALDRLASRLASHETLSARTRAGHTKGELLTPTELRVLEYASRGLTNQMIADATNVTRDSAKASVKRAIRVLGAKNRTHAVAEALRRRLIL